MLTDLSNPLFPLIGSSEYYGNSPVLVERRAGVQPIASSITIYFLIRNKLVPFFNQ